MTSLPRTSAPASRALANAGIQALDDLTKHTEAEILALHGMGPKAMEVLRGAMRASGLPFKSPST